MIFKSATIADAFVAFVFSSMRYYYPLSITGCDINANVEDRGYFENVAGTEKGLNHSSTFDDADREMVNFCNLRYITFSDTASISQNSHNKFTTKSLNIQSINARFKHLYPILSKLSSMGLYFGAICLHETWLTSDADLSLFKLPGYNIILQGSKCTKHSGLRRYLNEIYSYKLRYMSQLTQTVNNMQLLSPSSWWQ